MSKAWTLTHDEASVVGRIPRHPIPEEWRKRAAWMRRAAASCSWMLFRMEGAHARQVVR